MRQFWNTLACSLAYLAVAVACLVQWNGPGHWLRVDWFAGTYFLLRFAGSLHSVGSSLSAFRSKQVRHEWWALNSDPGAARRVMLLMALDLLVFLDYGHWRLTPWLMLPALQISGLALYVAVTCWQFWTDSYLARYFDQNETPPVRMSLVPMNLVPMNQGPYRYVRHPRYAAAIVGKVAMALTFASAFGWLLVIAWALLLLRKIAVEERHLRKLFGLQYESYARTTARVIPGIY